MQYTLDRYGCAANGSTSPSPSSSPVAPSTGDSDNDGIADHKDKCLGTPAGANVWKDESGPNARWLGCSGGQTPDN